ncbi:MAG TPA: hypothetical protein PKH94_10465 [Bacteroidales bacterium]|nr:hypothetical protein [Bacteroidales bacterium]HNS47653.1 hypothetical protein [Bacteroidales bacterium]
MKINSFSHRGLILMTGLALFFSSCGLFEQVGQMATLAKCDFRLKSVQQLTLAGVNIQEIKSISDLGLIDAGIITAALAGGQLPLNFTLNIEAKNPNDQLAAMNRLDWILFIDDIEMLQGVMSEKIQIPGNGGVSVIPLKMNMDLKKVLSGKSAETIINFGFNLAGLGGEPTRITVKAKPTIMVGSREIVYPGYISITTRFGNEPDKKSGNIKLN